MVYGLATIYCYFTQLITSLWRHRPKLRLPTSIFQSIESICVSDSVPNKRDFFINRSSINTCRERFKEAVGNKTWEWELNKDKSSLDNFTDILHPNLAQGFFTDTGNDDTHIQATATTCPSLVKLHILWYVLSIH